MSITGKHIKLLININFSGYTHTHTNSLSQKEQRNDIALLNELQFILTLLQYQYWWKEGLKKKFVTWGQESLSIILDMHADKDTN